MFNEPLLAELVDDATRLPSGGRGRRRLDRREVRCARSRPTSRHRRWSSSTPARRGGGSRRPHLGGVRQDRRRFPSARTTISSWGRRTRAAGATPAPRRSTSFWPWPIGRRQAARRHRAAVQHRRAAPDRPLRHGRAELCAAALPGEPITVFGDGKQSRCFMPRERRGRRARSALMDTSRRGRADIQHRQPGGDLHRRTRQIGQSDRAQLGTDSIHPLR